MKNAFIIILSALLVLAAGPLARAEGGTESINTKTETNSAVYTMPPQDREFILELEKRSFTYFTEQADRNTGLVRDRARADGSAGGEVASIAATGFGLTALCIGASHGWISAGEAKTRVRDSLEFLVYKSTAVRGWFYHFIDPATGERRWNSEVSSIDTGFLIAGALTAKAYFAEDKDIARLADELYSRVDFVWMLNGGKLLSHGWTPESGFIGNQWDTYSEHLLLSILAIGAPENPVPPQMWKQWHRGTITYAGSTFTGAHAPLFIHQYPQAWLDLRGVTDAAGSGVKFFDNSVTATKAHRQFCADLNSRFSSYTKDIWGITASDGATGYHAWGGPPATSDIDGTLVPCAAGGSLMFTPEIAVATLRAQKEKYGDKIWVKYGFVDAYNPLTGWTGTDVIGIDVGITLLSAENLLTGNVWKWFMRNNEPVRGMKLAGLKTK